MNAKKIITLLLALVLILSFAACGENGENNQTEPSTDPVESAPKTVECTFNAKTDDGALVSGLSFTLDMKGETFPLVTGSDGTVKASLPVGSYSISYDEATIPDGCTPDLFEIEVRESSIAFTLAFTNNMPDGSVEKPYFISDSVTAISLDAGEELHYLYRGAANKYIQICSEGVSIIYNDTVYEAVDGMVQVQLQAQIGAAVSFSVRNNTDAAIEASMELLAPLGSMENPIVLSENSAVAVVPANGTLCYQWTADKNGVAVVSSGNELNNISMVNMTTNAVSAQTGGSCCEYLPVNEGDTVIITVSSLAVDTESSIDFTVSSHLGTKEDAVPLLKDSVDISLGASVSLVFAADAGKTLTVSDADAAVIYGGKTYEPDEFGVISITFGGNNGETAIFTLTNTSDNINGITITLE